jgi:NADH dehydrogenase/NADH:ubiquinone oxidoreductase subunit G
MISVEIDGTRVECEERMTILDAARQIGITVPSLCHNDKLTPYGGCRVCLVEVQTDPKRPSRLLPACCTPAEAGMAVTTSSERVIKARQFVIELLLSRCPDAPEIQQLAADLGVDVSDQASLDTVGRYLLFRAPGVEDTKCIRCGLCVRVCAEITERHALSFSGRGMQRRITSPFEKVAETCIGCGSCAYVCPTNTITIEEVT